MNFLSENSFFFQKLIKFLLVSCFGYIINILVFIVTLDDVPKIIPIYTILLDLTLPTRIWEFGAVLFAILATTIWNFIINKVWTFKTQTRNKTLVIQTSQYMVVGAIGAIENLGIYAILTTFLYVEEIPAVSIAFIVSVLSNFLLNNFWTFDERK